MDFAIHQVTVTDLVVAVKDAVLETRLKSKRLPARLPAMRSQYFEKDCPRGAWDIIDACSGHMRHQSGVCVARVALGRNQGINFGGKGL